MRETQLEAATSVVAWFYASQRGAFSALLTLQQIERARGLNSVGVLDATVMSEGDSDRVRIDRTIEFRETEEGALAAIFPPSILARRAVGPADEEVWEHFSTLGFQVNLLREIGENLPRGGAALVVLLKEGWLEELRQVIAGAADVQRWALEVKGPLA